MTRYAFVNTYTVLLESHFNKQNKLVNVRGPRRLGYNKNGLKQSVDYTSKIWIFHAEDATIYYIHNEKFTDKNAWLEQVKEVTTKKRCQQILATYGDKDG